MTTIDITIPFAFKVQRNCPQNVLLLNVLHHALIMQQYILRQCYYYIAFYWVTVSDVFTSKRHLNAVVSQDRVHFTYVLHWCVV